MWHSLAIFFKNQEGLFSLSWEKLLPMHCVWMWWKTINYGQLKPCQGVQENIGQYGTITGQSSHTTSVLLIKREISQRVGDRNLSDKLESQEQAAPDSKRAQSWMWMQLAPQCRRCRLSFVWRSEKRQECISSLLRKFKPQVFRWP